MTYRSDDISVVGAGRFADDVTARADAPAPMVYKHVVGRREDCLGKKNG